MEKQAVCFLPYASVFSLAVSLGEPVWRLKNLPKELFAAIIPAFPIRRKINTAICNFLTLFDFFIILGLYNKKCLLKMMYKRARTCFHASQAAIF